MLTIMARVRVLGAVALLCVLGSAAAAYVATSRLSDVAETYEQALVPALQSLSQIGTAVGRVASAGSALENGALEAAEHQRASALIARELDATTATAKALDSSRVEAVSVVWRHMEPVFVAWRRDLAELDRRARARAAAAERFAEAAAIQGEVSAQYELLRRDSAQLLELTNQAVAELVKLSEQTHERAAAAHTLGSVLLTASFLAAASIAALALAIGRAVAKALAAMREQALGLADAVAAGELSRRADPESVAPEFRPVLAGMNRTMDAFVRPIQLTAACLDRISRGDLPPALTEESRGDFAVIQQSLNRCIAALHVLVEEIELVIRAGAEGQLSVRAAAGRCEGVYARLLGGVNATLDHVLAPVQASQRVLERVAQRDLTARVDGRYPGDHARTAEAINSATRALHEAFARVAESAEQVLSASSQIASSSQAVASGASEQASALEETSATLESISSHTQQAAASAGQADELSSSARALAQEGADAMERMKAAMGQVRQAAEGTSAIIKDISEIAFQTNLLALNAAVEAARAGDAGRGFAVVAEEVRSLALRAKEAAVRTEELIKQSVRLAGDGEDATRDVGDKLGRILGTAQRVAEVVAGVATAAEQQATGIAQVKQALEEMGKVTQQNAASSEESSAAAEELSSQSQELAALVRAFHLGDDGAHPALPPPPPPLAEVPRLTRSTP